MAVKTYFLYRGIYRAAWFLFNRLVTRMLALNVKWNASFPGSLFLTGDQVTEWTALQALSAAKLADKIARIV